MVVHVFRLGRPLTLACCFAVWLLFGATAVPCRAQQEAEPAMEEPAAGDAPAGDEAMPNEPAGDELDVAEEKPKPPVRPRAKGDKSDADSESSRPTEPAVQAVLESHPTTPAELLRAINILVDLGHAPLAKPFLDELGQRKLDPAAKAALAAQFNSATLMKLAHNAELGAVLAPFVDDLFKAAEAFRRDPARLAAWAKQLSDSDETIRAQATLALIRAREAAVAPLVDILADPKRSAEYPAAREILVELDGFAVAPLLGVLESPDAAVKTQVIEILGRLRAAPAVAQLLGPLVSPASTPQLRAAAAEALAAIGGQAPGAAEALRLLDHAARRDLDQSRQEGAAASAPVELWHWNAHKNQSMPIQYDATGARLASAARLARDLYALDTDNAAYRRLYLTALLQAAKFRLGLDKPLPTGKGTAYAVAAAQGADVIDDVLADAMAKGYLPAASAAAQILGDIGDAGLLIRGGGAPSPLALAARNADRRLRFAAVGAIMKLKPTAPFAGSNYVTDALGYFASSYGVPRALIVHPRVDQAQKLAGLAAGLGYESDVATNGRKAFELAVNSPDYDFALVHSAVERVPLDDLLAQLRRDRRTMLLPVGLMAPLDDLERITRFATGVARAEAFLQPQNADEMKLFALQVLSRSARWHVSQDERLAQATAALTWLAELSDQPARIFDVGRQEAAIARALFVPQLSAPASVILGRMGTVRAQHSLLELADLPTQPLAARQMAAAAFARSIERFGILLASDEILAQYDLYNSNAGRNADTHAVLAIVLDAIEHKKVPLAGQ